MWNLNETYLCALEFLSIANKNHLGLLHFDNIMDAQCLNGRF